MQPIKNQVLVKPFLINPTTQGGLIVPDSCLRESQKCEIISVGTGTSKIPMQFKEGQIIFRVKDWGIPVEIEGQMHYIMEQNTILAVVN